MTDRVLRVVLAGVIAAMVAGGCAAASPQAGSTTSDTSSPPGELATDDAAAGSPDYQPEIDPARFSTDVDNEYFPLPPGATWTYDVTTAEGSVDQLEMTVTDGTRTVMGVTTTVARVTLTVDGEIEEITDSWYAQDDTGAVWLFGEIDEGYENGELVETSTWEAGVDGAQPGIVMLGDGAAGETYRVGYLAGVMEERSRRAATDVSVSTPAGDFSDVWLVETWSDLEPYVVERKHYAPEIGLVFADSESPDTDVVELVSSSLAP